MLPTPSNDVQQKIVDDIHEYGLHVLSVLEDEEGVDFSYSVGLWRTYGHPEILIIGLGSNISHWIINTIANRIKNRDETMTTDQSYAGFLEGFECLFFEVSKTQCAEFVHMAMWFYEQEEFPVLQLVYPSTEGHFPWEKGASASFQSWQPVLNSEDLAG